MTPGEPIALIGHDVVLRRGVLGNWYSYFTKGKFCGRQVAARELRKRAEIMMVKERQ